MSKKIKTLQKARQYFESRLATAQKSIDQFSETVKKNPLYAMEWSQNLFGDAAWVALSKDVLQALEGVEAEEQVERIAEHLKSQAIREVRYPSRSTSVTSNLAAQERARVFLEAAEYLVEPH